MLRLRFTAALVLLVCLTLPCVGCARQIDCTFAPQSTQAGPVITDGFGVNIHFTDPQPGEIEMIAAAGFRWVRMDFKWDATERERGTYDFSEYARLLAALESYNIHPLFILDYGNPLYDNGAPPRNETARRAFARWAVAAAKHFAGRGVIWEVYNEPNHSMFWPPRPNPQEYAALALAVGRAFRETVPGEKLVGPATSEIDFDFLETCFRAGLLEYWSAVSIHPYRRNDPETAAQDYCRLREMIRTYAPAGTGSSGKGALQKKEIPIISSEWGYSSGWRGISEEKQAQLLARSWLTNAGNQVSVSIWYDWRDDGLDPNDPEHHFGMVFNSYQHDREPVYNPKPTYLAAKTLSAFFSGYRFERRLDVGGEDNYVLAFRKGNDLRFAAWTTVNRAAKVLIAVNSGRYAIIRHTGQDAGTVTADARGLSLTLTTAPVYFR